MKFAAAPMKAWSSPEGFSTTYVPPGWMAPDVLADLKTPFSRIHSAHSRASARWLRLLRSVSSSPEPPTPTSRARRATSNSRGSFESAMRLTKVGSLNRKRTSSTLESSSLSSP